MFCRYIVDEVADCFPDGVHRLYKNWALAHRAYSEAYHAGRVQILITGPNADPSVPENPGHGSDPDNAILIPSSPHPMITGPGSSVTQPITFPSTPRRLPSTPRRLPTPRLGLMGPGAPGSDILRWQYFGIEPFEKSAARLERAAALADAALKQREKDFLASFGYKSPSLASTTSDDNSESADADHEPKGKARLRSMSDSSERQTFAALEAAAEFSDNEHTDISNPVLTSPTAASSLASPFELAITAIRASEPSNAAGPSTPTRKHTRKILFDDDDNSSDDYSSLHFDYDDPVLIECLDNPLPINSPGWSYRCA